MIASATIHDSVRGTEFTLGLILLVGVIYYLIAQRNAPETKAIAPAEAPAA